MPLIRRSQRLLLHRANSVCFLGMQEKHQKDTKPGPCAEGTKLDVARLEHLVATHCRLREEQIEQLERLADLLCEFEQIEDTLLQIRSLGSHDCLNHQKQRMVTEDDEDGCYEHPEVVCSVCDTDITELVYPLCSIEPEEYNPEERSS